MIVLRRNLACLTTAAVFLSIDPTIPLAQDTEPCSKINYIGVGCAAFKFIGVERGKPFTAQRSIVASAKSPDGSERTIEWTELVSRNSAGRIRFEQSEEFKPPADISSVGLIDHEIEKVLVRGSRPGRLVTIFDCFSGTGTAIQPELKTANVMQTCNTLPPFRDTDEPYSQWIATLLAMKSSPEVILDNLGYAEIQGVRARGLGFTRVGSENDLEWNGKPTVIGEKWMSDDLAATVLQSYSDLRKHTETRVTLTHIERNEPDSRLFEIPPGYTIKFVVE
jgi:hypothetical protein